MNVEAYISSGILEAYALGELSEQERAEVEKNLAAYPALRKELALIEEAQENLLMKAAVQPRASVKAKLFSSIDTRQSSGKVIEMKAISASEFWKMAAAASIAVALLTSYLAFNYWNKWKSSETRLADLVAQNQRIAQDYNTINLSPHYRQLASFQA